MNKGDGEPDFETFLRMMFEGVLIQRDGGIVAVENDATMDEAKLAAKAAILVYTSAYLTNVPHDAAYKAAMNVARETHQICKTSGKSKSKLADLLARAAYNSLSNCPIQTREAAAVYVQSFMSTLFSSDKKGETRGGAEGDLILHPSFNNVGNFTAPFTATFGPEAGPFLQNTFLNSSAIPANMDTASMGLRLSEIQNDIANLDPQQVEAANLTRFVHDLNNTVTDYQQEFYPPSQNQSPSGFWGQIKEWTGNTARNLANVAKRNLWTGDLDLLPTNQTLMQSESYPTLANFSMNTRKASKKMRQLPESDEIPIYTPEAIEEIATSTIYSVSADVCDVLREFALSNKTSADQTKAILKTVDAVQSGMRDFANYTYTAGREREKAEQWKRRAQEQDMNGNRTESFQRGFEWGQKQGFFKGKAEGKKEGFYEGNKTGFEAGKKAFTSAAFNVDDEIPLIWRILGNSYAFTATIAFLAAQKWIDAWIRAIWNRHWYGDLEKEIDKKRDELMSKYQTEYNEAKAAYHAEQDRNAQIGPNHPELWTHNHAHPGELTEEQLLAKVAKGIQGLFAERQAQITRKKEAVERYLVPALKGVRAFLTSAFTVGQHVLSAKRQEIQQQRMMAIEQQNNTTEWYTLAAGIGLSVVGAVLTGTGIGAEAGIPTMVTGLATATMGVAKSGLLRQSTVPQQMAIQRAQQAPVVAQAIAAAANVANSDIDVEPASSSKPIPSATSTPIARTVGVAATPLQLPVNQVSPYGASVRRGKQLRTMVQPMNYLPMIKAANAEHKQKMRGLTQVDKSIRNIIKKMREGQRVRERQNNRRRGRRRNNRQR